MKKAAFTIMVITILSKFVGFGREMILSYIYGASAITDAYLISQTIPNQIFGFVAAGTALSFIPMYNRILKEKSRLEADRYTNNLLNFLLFLATVTVLIVLLFTQPLVRLFAIGFSGETLNLAIKFTRISVFAVYFTAVISIFTEYLRQYNNFIVPASIGFPLNLVTICSLILSSRTDVRVLAIGTIVASAAQLLLLYPSMRKIGYRYQPRLNLNDKYLKMLFKLVLPIILSRSVSRINVLVDRTIASAIVVGGISALNYADKIGGFMQSLLVDSISTVLYPNISKLVSRDDVDGLKSSLSEAINTINLVIIPATIGVMVFSEQIVILLFGRGAFTSEAIQLTSIALFYYSIGMMPKGMRSITSRAFYAHQDSRTPMINATIGLVLNIILNFILSKFMGLAGLALATSISATVIALLMFISLRKRIGAFGLKEIAFSFIKIICASLIMGLVARTNYSLLVNHINQNWSLVLSVFVGIFSYSTIIYFMKVPELDKSIAAIKQRIKERSDTGDKS
ncbi:MAG: murein biosynthesis integral membrane protein MurJ [Bacteroidales bacterium]|nr:murein biosynthesis integral membrane protein MurJ [Bacteroidales bacterium]